jgi:hypothetical protein
MTFATFGKILVVFLGFIALLFGLQYATELISAANTVENVLGWVLPLPIFFLYYRLLRLVLPKKSAPASQCSCPYCNPESDESKENAQ